MSFRYERLPAGIWLSLSGMNLAVSFTKLSRHGWHDRLATVELVSWGLMFLLLAAMFSTQWSFDDDALIQSRCAMWKLRVPFTEIVSVDPLHGGKAATITYGGTLMFTQPAALYVKADDMPGFLSQLEQRLPPGLVHM